MRPLQVTQVAGHRLYYQARCCQDCRLASCLMVSAGTAASGPFQAMSNS